MRKPIPYKPPQPKKNIIEKIKIKKVLLFIVSEIFLIVIAISLTAVVSILFSLNIIISIVFVAVFLSFASYYIATKFFRKN